MIYRHKKYIVNEKGLFDERCLKLITDHAMDGDEVEHDDPYPTEVSGDRCLHG